MTSTKHRLLSGFLSLLMVLLLVIEVFPPIEVVAASHSPTKLTNPSISPVQIGERLYEGYYNGEVSNSSSLTVKWKDVGQEYFNVAVKVLSGEPAPGDNENGELISDYTTNYTKTSL